jgi:4,5-dihydroxyphthalate decarboxylase
MSLVPGPLTDPLISKEVTVGGDAAWSITPGASVDSNSRSMLDGKFDVAEMSFATFLKAFELGRDLIGVPLFTGRGFLQPGILCSTAAGISRPEDLAGKRIGVPQYWMTSSVWHRGILEQQHGVGPAAVQWFTSAEERFENLVFPKGVSVQRLPADIGPQDALKQGLVDAIMTPPRGVPKSMPPGLGSPYADLAQAQRDYFSKTHVFPIMHFVVLRKSLIQELPWLVGAVTSAFNDAKKIADANGSLWPVIAGLPPDEERRLVGNDPWAFGLAANKAAVDTFFGFAHGQNWVGSGVNVGTCFV